MEGRFYFENLDFNYNRNLNFHNEGIDLTRYTANEILFYFRNKANKCFIDKEIIDIDDEYAIAITNNETSEINLIRDVFGLIPLYYTIQKTFVAYSTNINYLLNLPEFKKKANLNKIYNFLNGQPPYTSYDNETFFEDIYSVIPGQILTINKFNVSYSNFFYFKETNLNELKKDEYAVNFLRTFKKSLSKKISGIKNVSSFLSGGIDSSSITCILSEISERPINSIEVRTNFEIVDERQFAQDVVEKYKLNHTIISEFDNYLANEIDFTKVICEPAHFGLSISRHYEISKIIQKLDCEVLFDGFGGDEILGMDNLYFEELFTLKEWKKLNFVLSQRSKNHKYNFWVNKILFEIKQKNVFKGFSYYLISDLKIKLFLSLIKKILRKKNNSISNNEIILIPKPKKQSEIYKHLELIKNENNILHLDYIKTFMNQNIISFTEKAFHMGDKFNYKYRFPFLNLQVASLIAACPKEYNFGNGISRFVIREALKGILPESVRLRKSKTAFNPLIIEIYKKKYPEFINQYLNEHIIWQFVSRLKFMEMSESIIKENYSNYNNLSFCNRVISLGIWLDIFFNEK